MNGRRPPQFGEVRPIVAGKRPFKVWNHLYDRRERWDRLFDGDLESLIREGESATGLLTAEHGELPSLPRAVKARAFPVLRRHHDRAYAPVYLGEIRAEATLWTPEPDEIGRFRALGPRSVFLVVQLGAPWQRVVTAFRPVPPVHDVPFDEARIRREAIRYFTRKTGMHDPDAFATRVADDLREAAAHVPSDLADVWALAAAVGYGRQLRASPTVGGPLGAAERMLAAVSPALLSSLAVQLDWNGTLARLRGALTAPRSEALEDVLTSAEDLLVVAPVLGIAEEAQRFTAAASALLSTLPPGWAHLAREAPRRMARLGGDGSPAATLWKRVYEVLAVANPASTAGVARAPWTRWLQAAHAASGRAADWVRTAVTEATSSLQAVAPAPAMGVAPADSGRPWTLSGRPPRTSAALRLFVVDADEPEGAEMTADWLADGTVWELDRPGHEVLVVVVAGERPPAGETLREVLDRAAARDDVAVVVRAVSRPR